HREAACAERPRAEQGAGRAAAGIGDGADARSEAVKGRNRSIAACCAAAAAVAASGAGAATIDLNSGVAERPHAARQPKAIYKKQTGKDLPADTKVTATYTGANASKTSCTANVVLSGPVRLEYGEPYTWLAVGKDLRNSRLPPIVVGPKKSTTCRVGPK